MHIVIAADHRGFELKTRIIPFLENLGHQVLDVGNSIYDPDDDYPDFVFKLVQELQKNEKAYGIVCCASGVGVSVAANRFPHIRCGLCVSKKHVVSARADDNINVLALPTEYITLADAEKMTTIFLNTEFKKNPRYARRLQKLENYANNANR
jgi:ribose 5-phosphate isomerase B